MTHTDETVDLLPCPFCGSDMVKSGGDDKVVGVWCENCQASGPNGYLTINGEHEWNTRAALDAMPVAARIEALEALVGDMAGALEVTREIVVKGAVTGFNHADGTWADELFSNNGKISATLAKHKEVMTAPPQGKGG